MAVTRKPRAQRWTLEQVPWREIRRDAVASDDIVFYLVVSAAFVETATDGYTRNLIGHYADDPEVAAWLELRWQHEELQHGQALMRYARAVWPGFDWQRSYAGFLAEFSAKCAQDTLESSRSLEAVSRCIVEMGTASYYLALSRLSPEPVLSLLAGLIREDEVRHYKYFYRWFRRYCAAEQPGRAGIFRAIWRRLRMIDFSDSSIALKHAYLARHPGESFDRRRYRHIQRRVRHAMGANFPVQMSAKMTLKPLDLDPRLQKVVLSTVTLISPLLLGSAGQDGGVSPPR